MRFDNKVAIITGGTTGIGRATANALTKEGCKVYVLDIKPVTEKNDNLIFIECDVRSHEAVSNAVDSVLKREGKRKSSLS